MGKKLRILLVLVSLSLTLGLMSNTYSRYVADANEDIKMLFAKWQILVNNTDITNSSTSSIDLTPVLEENENISENTIAPSSKGYFDIDIDPSNVDVSFNYTVSLNVLNEDMPDLMIAKYSLLDENYIEGDEIEINELSGNTITGTLNYNNAIENFKFEPFTIRIYFEWYEGESENMNDEADSKVGSNAALNDSSLEINAQVHFEQKLD